MLRWYWHLPLWHLLCLRVIAINLCFVPYNNAWQEDTIFGTLQYSVAHCCMLSCLIFCEKLRNKVGQHTSHSKINVSIVPTEILSSSTSSLIIKCQFLLMNSLMWSAILLVWAVDGQPVSGPLLMAVWPFLKWEYHSDGLDWLSVVLLNVDYSILHVLVAAY